VGVAAADGLSVALGRGVSPDGGVREPGGVQEVRTMASNRNKTIWFLFDRI
jgi:hypothetical protein